MKKVLFATTALVATAGVAAADVSLSGMAEMGLFGGDGVNESFFTDIDVTFTMSGTTDNGLTFGASVDLDEGGAGAPAVANNADDGGATIFISGDFGTITMGDTDGALDWALQEANIGNAGSIADDETSHAGYVGAYADGFFDGQILRYDYSVGDFGFAISVEMDDAGLQDNGYAIGFRYGLDLGGADVDLGFGYQTATSRAVAPGNFLNTGLPLAANVEVTVIGVSGAVTLDSGLSASLGYTDWEVGINTAEHIALGLAYTFDAFTVSFNWGDFSSDFAALDQVSGYGLAAAYNLGGGLSLHAGYGLSERGALETETWSFGAAMSF